MTKHMIIAAALFSAVVTTAAEAQKRPRVEESLHQLQSSDPNERAVAFSKLSSNPDALAMPAVAAALVALLERENRLVYSTLRESKGEVGVSGKYGEGYSEYYAEVLEACNKFCDKSSNRTLEALANGAYNSGSTFAIELAEQFGDRLVPFFQKLATSDWPPRRRDAVLMLKDIWIHDRSLSAANRELIHQAVTERSRDERSYVREAAARALGDIGNPNDIALLEQLAASDAEEPVRREAVKSIARIRQPR